MIQALKTLVVKIVNLVIKIAKTVWSPEFAFIVIIGVAALAGMVAVVVEGEKAKELPSVEKRAEEALVIAQNNQARVGKLENKIEEQRVILDRQPIIIERQVNAAQKPFNSSDLRARAQRLRNEQRAADRNRQ